MASLVRFAGGTHGGGRLTHARLIPHVRKGPHREDKDLEIQPQRPDFDVVVLAGISQGTHVRRAEASLPLKFGARFSLNATQPFSRRTEVGEPDRSTPSAGRGFCSHRARPYNGDGIKWLVVHTVLP